jgi:hypothetical protein
LTTAQRKKISKNNFIKIHRTLRCSPAMAAGVTNCLFDVSDLVVLLVESDSKKAA